jgi:HSP20 family molecular chaperone IbpA
MDRYETMELAKDRPLYELSGVLSEPVPAGRWAFSRQRRAWCPPTDVYETADCLFVKAEIAGMQRTDLHIALKAKELTISGIRQDSSAKVGYQQMEIQYGSFESHVSLPVAVEEEAVEATYQDGFLTIRLPKAKPHQVHVTYT